MGVIFIDYSDIGFFNIPPNSVLLVDEAGMVWDNRAFKSSLLRFGTGFKLQRHYRVKVYLFRKVLTLMNPDILTDDLYLCTNMLQQGFPRQTHPAACDFDETNCRLSCSY